MKKLILFLLCSDVSTTVCVCVRQNSYFRVARGGVQPSQFQNRVDLYGIYQPDSIVVFIPEEPKTANEMREMQAAAALRAVRFQSNYSDLNVRQAAGDNQTGIMHFLVGVLSGIFAKYVKSE